MDKAILKLHVKVATQAIFKTTVQIKSHIIF